MAQKYYDSLSAPEKNMVVLDGAGHPAALRNRALCPDALLDVEPVLSGANPGRIFQEPFL